MINLFSYNWQVRDDWFKWCESLPENELHAERTGGMKSIFKNLLHIVDCELLWVNYMLQEPYTYEKRDAITSLKELIEYSDSIKKVTGYFLGNWNDECEKKND